MLGEYSNYTIVFTSNGSSKTYNKSFFVEKDELMSRINTYNRYVEENDSKIKAIIDAKITNGGLAHYLHATMGHQSYVYGIYSTVQKQIIWKIRSNNDLRDAILDTNLDAMGGDIIADPLNLERAHHILNDIKNDYSLFVHLRKLQGMKRDIESKLQDITNIVREVCNSISIDDHHTKRKCCPTFW